MRSAIGLATLLLPFMSGCGAPAGIEMNSSSAKQDLETLSTARILFGHKSVGQNVIEGLQDLSAELGVSIRILPVNGVPPDDAPGFFHSEIGDNGDPDGKCERFSQLLTRPEKPAYDLA